MSKRLHIICFDNPYPPSYGGAIDVYYRVKALAEEGVQIVLYCFYKGELRQYDELERLCHTVHYYPRKTSIWQHIGLIPYGVASRTNDSLLPLLLQDDAPILFEGLVSCALMGHPALQGRKKIFRECNVEHDYYHALGRASHSWWKKIFYHLEAWRLQSFEHCLCHAQEIWALAHQDEAYFRTYYPTVTTRYVPCAHSYKKVTASTGIGEPYILYHGNLAVEENEKAALHIIRFIAPKTTLPVVIAGYQPSARLYKAAQRFGNVRLVASPKFDEMEQLIQQAHIHLLITFQPTGIKLKLLHVLYKGRHIIVNPLMVVGTEYGALCHIGQQDEELIALCNQYCNVPFSNEDIKLRQMLLQAEKHQSYTSLYD